MVVDGGNLQEPPLLKFLHYYGHDVWIVPARVLYVEDGGCGSRGVAATVHLDNGDTISLNARAEDVQRQIVDALSAA